MEEDDEARYWEEILVTMKKALLLLVSTAALWGAFFIPAAYASVLYSQPFIGSHIDLRGAGHSNNYMTGVSGTATDFYILVTRKSANANVVVTLSGFNNAGRAGPCAYSAATITASGTVSIPGEQLLLHGHGSIPLDPACFYYVDDGTPTDYWAFGDGSSNIYLEISDYPLYPTDQEILEGLSFGTSTALVLNVTASSSLYSGLSATSTLNALQNQCAITGNIFAEGLCVAFSFLFVPNTQTVAQFASIKTLASGKIPFSYVASIKSTIDSIATSSSSQNFPLFIIPLSHYASSTITGIIPDLVFSTTTISTYFPDSVRLALRTLLIAIIWLSAGWFAYYEGMKAIHPKT